MNPTRHILLVLGALLASAPAFAFEMVREGRAVASILDQGHTEQAGILRGYVAAISGAELPAAADAPAGAPLVVLEVTDAIDGLSERLTARQGYRIRVEGNRLTLSARTARGLTYAVYGLLEDHLGVRFFAPDCEDVPETRTLALGPLDEVREPAFQVRSTFMALGPERPNEWEVRNRGGGLPADILVSRHGFYDWIHPGKYLEAHPEWFPLIDGKRQQHWLHGLCYSNPELARQMAANIMERIRTRNLPSAIPIAVGQGDGFVACQCEVCRAMAKENQSEAGPVILLLNRVLEAMADAFPEHQLITFAYAQTIRVPKTVKPHSNLWINIVSSSSGGEGWGPFSGGDMIGPIRGNPENAVYREAIEQWPRIARGRVTIWHWSTGFNDQSVEWPNLFTMADNIRFWREQGIAAVALQTTGGGGNWGWLKHWVWLKLLWNPDAEIEPLIQEFLAGYYGREAAPVLWDYHQELERVRAASGYAANACDSRAANAMALLKGMYPPEVLARLDSLLERAMEAAARESDPVYANRVAHARAYSTDQLKLVEAADVQPYPGGYFYPPETVTLHRIRDPRDGSYWLVPGTTPDMPARVQRRDEALKATGAQEWGAAYMTRFWFQRGAGGRLTRIENPALAVEVCPNLLGTITSIIHKPTGQELLTGRFPLVEWHSGMRAMEWFLPEVGPRRVEMEQWIQTDNWFYMGDKQRYRRTLELHEQDAVMNIARRFEGEALRNEPGMPAMSSFPSTWYLLVADPDRATLTVTAGGETQALSLAEKGSLEMLLHAADEGAGDVAVQLDRGDGLIVRLTSPVAGWTKLSAAANPDNGTVSVTLHGEARSMSREAHVMDLPGWRIEVANAIDGGTKQGIQGRSREGKEGQEK